MPSANYTNTGAYHLFCTEHGSATSFPTLLFGVMRFISNMFFIEMIINPKADSATQGEIAEAPLVMVIPRSYTAGFTIGLMEPAA